MDTLPIHEPYVQKLRERARRWGGDIIKVATEVYAKSWKPRDGFSDAPFTMKTFGVHWGKKVIVLAGVLPDCAELIHEMGHVFACNQSPSFSDEYPFLGWEYAMMRSCRFPIAIWHEFMKGYTVQAEEEACEWFHLESEEKDWVLNERLGAAKSLGLLDDKFRPRAIR